MPFRKGNHWKICTTRQSLSDDGSSLITWVPALERNLLINAWESIDDCMNGITFGLLKSGFFAACETFNLHCFLHV